MKNSLLAFTVGTIIAGGLFMAGSCDLNFGDQTYQPTPDYGLNEDTYEPGEGWSLSWTDEFNGSVLDNDVWDRQVLLNPYNSEWQRYTGGASTAYVEDNCLVLKATHDSSTHAPGNYTSARVISNPGGYTGATGSTGKTFRYGKIAARIKLPSGKGIWPAFWLLGDNINETGGTTSWPTCGEIDILETGSITANDGYYGHATAGQALHFTNSSGYEYKGSYDELQYGKYSDNFHVFEIEWDSQKIVWKIDSEIVHSEMITESYMSEFHQDFYVIFNIAVGGSYTHDPDSTTGFPQYMYIDWIRHYEKN